MRSAKASYYYMLYLSGNILLDYEKFLSYIVIPTQAQDMNQYEPLGEHSHSSLYIAVN